MVLSVRVGDVAGIVSRIAVLDAFDANGARAEELDARAAARDNSLTAITTQAVTNRTDRPPHASLNNMDLNRKPSSTIKNYGIFRDILRHVALTEGTGSDRAKTGDTAGY